MRAHAATALCGVKVAFAEFRVPFEMNGCTRCARAAVKEGTTHVVDVDGHRIALAGFKPW